jgi:hypothetical protein
MPDNPLDDPAMQAAFDELQRQHAASDAFGLTHLDADDLTAVTIGGTVDLLALVAAMRGEKPAQ